MMDNIKDIINSVIEKIAAQGPQRYDRLQEFWKKTQPSKAGRHTRFVGMKDGQVLIYVDSSAWLYQLNLKRDTYLKKFQEAFPGIQGIFFKIGKVDG